jgi:hypothetical protein
MSSYLTMLAFQIFKASEEGVQLLYESLVLLQIKVRVWLRPMALMRLGTSALTSLPALSAMLHQ